MAELDGQKRGTRPWPGDREERGYRRRRQVVEQEAVPGPGHRAIGIHVQPGELRNRDGRGRVDLRSQRPERFQVRGRVGGTAQVGDLDDGEGPAAKRFRDAGKRRQIEEPPA